MITKTYKANTNISINVVLPSKKNLHIAFVPLSNGSSVFTTDNEDIQKSVENHYKFGKLFKLHSVHGQSETVETAGKASKNGSSEKLHSESTHNGEDTPANETGRQDEMPQEDAGDNNTQSQSKRHCKCKRLPCRHFRYQPHFHALDQGNHGAGSSKRN